MEAAEEVISPTRSRLYLDSYLIYQKEEEGFDFGDRRESSGSGDILEKESVSIEEWVDVEEDDLLGGVLGVSSISMSLQIPVTDSGLLIGFSVMDLASVIKYVLDLANRVLNIP